jgi:hypothetical protein
MNETLKTTANTPIDFLLRTFYDITPLPNKQPQVKSLCTHIAERVCGEDVQDALIILSGKRGSGKSISALTLGEGISKEISRLKYGNLSHAEEIFNISHVSSIDPSSLLNIISTVNIQNSVIILDDGSLALNSRNSMTNINKMVVNLITVSRHKGNVVIITTPSRGQIDVQIRNMCSHWAEITDSHHEEGYNAMSFRRVFFNQNNGKTFTANLTAQDLGYEGAHANKLKFTRWIVPKPDDKKLIREYEKMRSTQGDALIIESQELLQAQLEQQKDKQLGNKKKNKKEEPITNIPIKTEIQRETVRKVEEVEEYLARGYTRTSACKMVKLDIKTYTKYKRGY